MSTRQHDLRLLLLALVVLVVGSMILGLLIERAYAPATYATITPHHSSGRLLATIDQPLPTQPAAGGLDCLLPQNYESCLIAGITSGMTNLVTDIGQLNFVFQTDPHASYEQGTVITFHTAVLGFADALIIVLVLLGGYLVLALVVMASRMASLTRVGTAVAGAAGRALARPLESGGQS